MEFDMAHDFSEVITIDGKSLTVRGDFDTDGNAVIDCVELGDSIENIWDWLEPGYNSMPQHIGNRIYQAIADKFSRDAATDESWGYDDTNERRAA